MLFMPHVRIVILRNKAEVADILLGILPERQGFATIIQKINWVWISFQG